MGSCCSKTEHIHHHHESNKTENDQPVQYEYLAVNGSINNFSTITFDGTTPQLQWGKWVTSPTFPVHSQDICTFKACGRASSPSGIEGNPGIILTYNSKQMRIYFSCPYSGDNYFYVQNDISEVDVKVQWGPGKSGHPVNGTIIIRNA